MLSSFSASLHDSNNVHADTINLYLQGDGSMIEAATPTNTTVTLPRYRGHVEVLGRRFSDRRYYQDYSRFRSPIE